MQILFCIRQKSQIISIMPVNKNLQFSSKCKLYSENSVCNK